MSGWQLRDLVATSISSNRGTMITLFKNRREPFFEQYKECVNLNKLNTQAVDKLQIEWLQPDSYDEDQLYSMLSRACLRLTVNSLSMYRPLEDPPSTTVSLPMVPLLWTSHHYEIFIKNLKVSWQRKTAIFREQQLIHQMSKITTYTS